MTELLKVTTIMAFETGLPADIAETTLYFVDDGEGEITSDNIGRVADCMETFWNEPVLTLASSLSSFISPVVSRTDERNGFRFVRLNSESGLEIGSPFFIASTFEGTGAGQPLPQEVALCMSFKSADEDGPLRRRRGRIYIGPLGEAHNAEAVDGAGRPTEVLINAINFAASRLQDQASDIATEPVGSSTPWVVYSRPTTDAWNATHPGDERLSGSFHRVTDGWVDNEWDTQRRRGLKATTRSTWAS